MTPKPFRDPFDQQISEMGIKQSKRTVDISSTPKKGGDTPAKVNILNTPEKGGGWGVGLTRVNDPEL